MKVLILSNMFPSPNNINRGIFINKRLEQYNNFNIDYTVIPVMYKDNLKILRKILKKYPEESIRELNGVKYSKVEKKFNIFEILWNEIDMKYFAKKFAKTVEEVINIKIFDIIHAHGLYNRLPAGLVANILSKKYNIPYFLSLHGSDINLVMKKRKNIYLEVLEEAKKSIFVSNALLKKAKEYGYSGNNSEIIPNGFDNNIFKSFEKCIIRKNLGIYEKNYYYVGFVGNLNYIKRADKLPEIFHLMNEKKKNIKFIIVGDGVLKKEIENKTKDLDIIFTGRLTQNEVAEYMNAMDIMILPSRNEGWPCVVLEANACGTLVIGSNSGGIPEAIYFDKYIINDGQNFEKEFAYRVIEILKKGYNKDILLDRSKNYTWENIVKKEIRLYEK
ncbi:glycosyltransferase [Marinitoga litoralis]|uniref:glycosyltransferase n=1 Tax=Marinitoga litoralis TaxID=570855 RepID=UPI00196176AE|nr:glycosyltransferase [Marinitoga litoralis]MBM7560125.1 glycosyltransferase involved in cell wall biosynthesis [Marinitoga litoralis]